ncbi:interleukin-18 receptor accessory protein [Rana temporaria]|uniref:interleukin-18 receptor accessory protein n=1 Tax=Rana temporaria TaxID=8407 RepID=UPI001AAD3249|nr:interleukin-18 receptor accessory protein [Rana temporaria]
MWLMCTQKLGSAPGSASQQSSERMSQPLPSPLQPRSQSPEQRERTEQSSVFDRSVFTTELAGDRCKFHPNCSDREPDYRYQVFAEENVFFQCPVISSYNGNEKPSNKERTQWFSQTSDGNIQKMINVKDLKATKSAILLWFSPAEMRHSGTYFCKVDNDCKKLAVIVQSKDTCIMPYGSSSLYFTTDKKNKSIPCPSQGCQQMKNISNLRWYKSEEFASVTSPVRISLNIINNSIQLAMIYKKDVGVYTCDFDVYINSSKWIVRATTKIKVGLPDTQKPPEIFGPSNGTIITAEIGKPLNLTCRIRFGPESSFKPVIKWKSMYPNYEKGRELSGGKELCLNVTGIDEKECFLTITLEKVTENDITAQFCCYAENAVGNVTTVVTLSLKQIDSVFLTYILCGAVLLLTILLLGSGMVYFYWIEIVLLYRNYISKDETIGDDKDFDAFISYASQGSELDMETTESYSDKYEEERFAIQFLPDVLEDKYNYKLCILERDILPGGAYVEDIAKIIKRSRRAIFILSEKYIRSPKVFELQAAITCSLEEQEALKLILIKFKPFKEPEFLPNVVRKALSTLPMVTWKGDLDIKTSQNLKFWNRIRYYMPVKKVQTSRKLSLSVANVFQT